MNAFENLEYLISEWLYRLCLNLLYMFYEIRMMF